MKALFIILFSFLASSSANAGEVFVDQIDEDWAYVCQITDGRLACEDVRVGILATRYGITECINHGWFDAPTNEVGDEV